MKLSGGSWVPVAAKLSMSLQFKVELPWCIQTNAQLRAIPKLEGAVCVCDRAMIPLSLRLSRRSMLW
jgi:hypothetical protein